MQHTIHTNTLEQHAATIEILNKQDTKYYTYTPANQRPKSYIVKGIRGDFGAEEILEEIKAIKPSNMDIIRLDKFQFDPSCPNKTTTSSKYRKVASELF